ncbi:MAG: alkaline phosphatase [Bacteroidales bacterium]|nr:alkaline phosphatase [Bacteroidales bacterium]
MKKLFALLIVIVSISAQFQAQPLAKHVILIGLDGWAAHDFDNVRNNIPNIRSLIKNGSCNMHKRSVLPSDSGVNWASMFMGVGPEMHGYTTWDSKKHDLPSSTTNKNGIFPTIFSIIREQHPEAETGCTFEWDGIKYVIDTAARGERHLWRSDRK